MHRQEYLSTTVQLATRIPKNLHLRVRVRALDEGVTMADWVGGALEDHLERVGARKRPGRAKAAADAD